MEYNISPETIIRDKNGEALHIDADIDKLIQQTENTSFAHQHNYSMASSGYCFSKHHQGVIPYLCDTFYAERNAHKKTMPHYQPEHEKLLIELRKPTVTLQPKTPTRAWNT